jgi:Fe-S oxidoreductase
MALPDRMATKRADGKDFDLSGAATFDWAAFYNNMTDREHLQLRKDEVAWLERYVAPERPADVVLNLSCGIQFAPHLMLLTAAIFRALDVDFVALAGRQFCCGRVYNRYGLGETGDRMATYAIERFASWQPSVNVQCCGSCQIEFLYHAEKIKLETGSAPFPVIHFTDYVLDTLKRRLAEGSIPWTKDVRKRVMLHAEGAEVHPTKEAARAAAIETLRLVPGVEYRGLVENPTLGSPCATISPGGPSILWEIGPDQYRAVQAELLAQAEAANADVLVTHHHFCHMEWSKFGSDRLPILHYLALVGEALGVEVEDRFQTFWRLGDPEAVLRHARPQWESWGISENDARALVRRYFVPEYAAALPRCACNGDCDAGAPIDVPWKGELPIVAG